MLKRAQARQIPVHESRGYKEANDNMNRDQQVRVFRSARINERGYYTRYYKDKEADGEVKQCRVACFNGTHNDDGTHGDEDYDDWTHDANDDGDWTPDADDGDWTHNDGDDDDGTDHDDDDDDDDDDGTHHVTPPIIVYTRNNKTKPRSDGILQDCANNISKRVELSCCTVPPPLPQQAVTAGQPFPCDITQRQSKDDASISSSGEWKSSPWGDKKCRVYYRKQYKMGGGMLRENTNKAGNGGLGMPGADSKLNSGVEDCGLLMSSRLLQEQRVTVQEPNKFSNMQDFGTGSRSAQWQQQQPIDIHNCNYMKLLQLVQHKQTPRERDGQSSNTTVSHVQEEPLGTSTTFSAEHSAPPHSPSAAISHQPVPLSTVLEALPNDFTDSELVISPPEVQSTNTTLHSSEDPQRQPHIWPSLYSEPLQKPAIIHQPLSKTNGVGKSSRISAMQTKEVTTEECEEKEDADLYTEPNQKPKRKKHRPKVIRDISKTKMRSVLKSTEKKVRLQGRNGLQDGGQKHLPRKQSTKEEYHVFESTFKCPLRVTKKKRTLKNRRSLFADNRAILNNEIVGTNSSCIVNRQDKEPGGIRFQFSALLNQFSKGQDQLASYDSLTHIAEGQVIYLHDICSAFSRELPHGNKFTVYTHPAENHYSERVYSAEAKCPQENYLALYSQLSDQHESLDTRDSELPLCLPSAADTSSTASNEFSLVQRSFTQLLLAQEPDNNLQMVVYDQKREMVVSKSTKPPEKIRAKVQMDIENERMWPLLALGSIPTDFEDPQYWEKERAVMKRRIELFIHRMHSVQGDRGFSPWKGSMVDSVVGAFLTQNVSDHLSSSAFMSVASRYPPAQSNDTGNASPPETNETPCEIQSDMEDFQRVPPGLVEEKPLDKQGDIDTAGLNDHGSMTVEFDFCGINVTCTELSDNKRLCSSLCDVKTDLKITCEDTSATSSPLKTRHLDYKRSANTSIEEDCNFIDEDCSGDHKVMEKGWQVSHQRTEVYRSNTVCRTLFKIDVAEHQGSKGAEQANSESEVSALNTHNCSHNTEFQLTMIQESNKQVDLEFDMVRDTEASLPLPKTIGKKRHISLSSISGIERAHLEENMKGRKKNHNQDWESIRKQTLGLCSGAGNPCKQHPREDTHQDSVDWESVRRASVEELAETIKERGMHHVLSGRIKAFLKTLHEEHGSIDLEWLRRVSPENAKAYLMSIHGLGVKSVECIRLLTLHHVAFPVDVNVGRICVRLGWVPIEPLPEELQLHLLELYPVQETIQKYLWPRLCTLDQKTLYEFHYQLITFGKVFCTKSKPNCNSCPMRTECKHFASAYASAKLLLTGPKDGQHNKICSAAPVNALTDPRMDIVGKTLVEYVEDNLIKDPLISEIDCSTINSFSNDHTFYIEEPASPEQTPHEQEIIDLEDFPYIYKNFNDFTDDLLTAGNLSKPPCMNGHVSCTYEEDMKSFDTQSSSTHAEVDASHKYSTLERSYSHSERDQFGANGGLFATPSPLCFGYQSVGDTPPKRPSSCESTLVGEAPKAIEEAPNAIIPLPRGAHIPAPKLKNVSRLRTVHYVYELPDTHPLLEKVDAREKDDPCSYLLAIWSPGETPESPQEINELCREDSHTSSDANADETISGTLLIPCRTAMQGSFPLNGTYFQVNEVFADHESSLQPFQVSRSEIWKLQRRFVYFGTSVPNIFRGLTTPEIKSCFLWGHICVRGFDRHKRAPKPLVCRLHFPISKQQRGKKAPKAEN